MSVNWHCEPRIGTEESQSADAVADATRARAAVNELRNHELQLHNSEQIMDDLLEQVVSEVLREHEVCLFTACSQAEARCVPVPLLKHTSDECVV